MLISSFYRFDVKFVNAMNISIMMSLLYINIYILKFGGLFVFKIHFARKKSETRCVCET